MQPMISVIIPTFNREKLIMRSVNSVLNQTYENIEIIIVDDCSTDDTEKVISEINDNRIRYVKMEKNSGACAARNYGIKIAKGEYIAFQDSDDVWYPEKLEIQLKKMNEMNSSVSFCNFFRHVVGKNDKELFPVGIPEGEVDNKIIIKESIVSTQCLMVKAECLTDIKFDISLPRLQDWDLVIELSKKYKIYHIDDVLVDMYVQNDSISAHPERGVIALTRLMEKNSDELKMDKEISRLWHIYMGDYLVESHKSPCKEYKKALDIKFSFKIAVYYFLSIIGILIPLKRLLGKI